MVLDDDQRVLCETARRFAQERLRPDDQKRGRTERLDRALSRELGEPGLIATDMPERYGGLDVSGLTTGTLIEQVAWGDINVSYMLLPASLTGKIIRDHAGPAVAEAWLPRMIRGESIVALSLTEPHGGSDAADPSLRARCDGDYYVTDGKKTSIHFANQADAIVLFARTGAADSGARGVSAFFVPLALPDIQRTRFNDLGSRIIGRGSVFFDGVRVPAANLLGAEGKGFVQVMQGFDYSRVLIALQFISAPHASLDETWEWTKERSAFGAVPGRDLPAGRVRRPTGRGAAALLPRPGYARSRRGAYRRCDMVLAAEGARFGDSALQTDVSEGLAAFQARRKPDFPGH